VRQQAQERAQLSCEIILLKIHADMPEITRANVASDFGYG
jgi:hypothetical protein